MKTSILLPLVLFFSGTLLAQQTRINLSDKTKCAINGEVNLSTINASQANNKIEDLLQKINKQAGFPLNYLVQSTANSAISAFAAVEENTGNRLIIYNDAYFTKITQGEGRYKEWTLIFVLAHEAGHHISGHTLKQNENREGEELTADYFGGFILGKLGAAQNEVLQAVDFLTPNPEDNIHPPKTKRIQQILAGWKSGNENQSGDDSVKPCTETISNILIINNSDKEKQIKEIIIEDGRNIPKYQNVVIQKQSSIKLTGIPIGTHTLHYYNSFYSQGNIWHDMTVSTTTFTVNGCNPNNQLILK